MEILNIETRNVQNPALGAILLWRFVIGYENGTKSKDPVPIPLLYIVLPMIFHEETLSFVESTHQKSGLRACAIKFAKSSILKKDLLFSIHERASKMKKLSTDSLGLTILAKLIAINPKEGTAFALTETTISGIPQSIKKMQKPAEKLGQWFSNLSIHEISVILKVAF